MEGPRARSEMETASASLAVPTSVAGLRAWMVRFVNMSDLHLKFPSSSNTSSAHRRKYPLSSRNTPAFPRLLMRPYRRTKLSYSRFSLSYSSCTAASPHPSSCTCMSLRVWPRSAISSRTRRVFAPSSSTARMTEFSRKYSLPSTSVKL